MSRQFFEKILMNIVYYNNFLCMDYFKAMIIDTKVDLMSIHTAV